VRADLGALGAWADRNRPVFVGEFGTYAAAPMSSRVQWTTTVRRELDALGIGWCYWDFATDFGAYDLTARAWRAPLVQALLGP
jgi:endoglucanase